MTVSGNSRYICKNVTNAGHMTDFNDILQTLLLSPENEVVEFKEAKSSFDINELGKYFSALSNEANLRGTDFAWPYSE